MSDIILYHNPRCSKSRAAVEFLAERQIKPEVLLYLEQPLTEPQLAELLSKLGMSARELMRKGEAIYQELNLANPELSEQQLIQAMAEHPKLIERPILVVGERAAIGRPTENLLEVLP
ncbi:arsenate reductase (glutaredoxin) [Thiopseudomonas alkaliphila]|uniref:arsenate reductase (glutaredoxin) n=1 Tax=Thiopseudomonas alkaliphila TaxID=1697053 RepID=UPI002576420F|nr:arsenate reductase (glutaredoxin) [Thiopseudomonas alkaliphila]MDM1706802.1 arsenate reductase (glutaredoxin) [Thiopseudomonas alkaliphila]